MNTLRLLDSLAAVQTGTAVARRAVRHMHVSDQPLVVCAYHLANENGAIVGLLFGTERHRPQVVAMGNPLDRDLRFAALTDAANAIVAYLNQFTDVETTVRTPSRGRRAGLQVEDVLAMDTPQIVTPNVATRVWLGDVLSRSLRYLRPTEQGVDPVLPLLGSHLTALTQESRSLLSSLVISATELLAEHWTTGQLPAETENLPALLAWITPPCGMTGREAAAAEEDVTPPAGPVPGQEFDDSLHAAQEQWRIGTQAGQDPLSASDAMRATVLAALRPGYEATFNALDLARKLPPADHDQDRHDGDRRAWARHLNRVDAGQAFFRRVQDPLNAARLLHRSENNAAEYARQQALDDPEVMKELLIDGEALRGEVISVDSSNRIGRSYRPLITIVPEPSYPHAPGATLHWAQQVKTEAEVTAVDRVAGTVTVRLAGGMGRGRPAPEALPTPGQVVLFSPHGPPAYFPGTLPNQLPWTHIPATDVVPQVTGQDWSR